MNDFYMFLYKYYILYSFCIERSIFYMFLCIAVLPLRLLSKIIMIYNRNCYFFMQIKRFILFKIDEKSILYILLFYLKLMKNPFYTSKK